MKLCIIFRTNDKYNRFTLYDNVSPKQYAIYYHVYMSNYPSLPIQTCRIIRYTPLSFDRKWHLGCINYEVWEKPQFFYLHMFFALAHRCSLPQTSTVYRTLIVKIPTTLHKNVLMIHIFRTHYCHASPYFPNYS